MNSQQIFSLVLLLVNAFALGAQGYAIRVVRRDRKYAKSNGLNGYFLRYSETTLNSLYLGLVSILSLLLIFTLALVDVKPREISGLQYIRGLLFVVLDTSIVSRSAYTAFRYHEDVTSNVRT